MANETLKIILTADNKQALTGLRETIAGLDGVSVAAGKTTKAVGGNTQAWLNWGRVVQDAPYGLNGIANNLTQVVPAVGALGFAFSGLIAAMTFAQVGFGAWTRGLARTKEETEKFNKELGKEIVEFRELYRAATNANIPMEARKKAVKDLRDQYGNYLKDFSDEAIMAGKAATAYNSLTDAIVRNAKAKAATAKITELAAKQLEIEQKMADLAAKTQKKVADNSARMAQRGGTTLREQEMTGGIQSATTTFNLAAAAMKGLVNEYEAINQQIKGLEGVIDRNTVKPFTDGVKEATVASTELDNILKQIQNRLAITKSLGKQTRIGASGNFESTPSNMLGQPGMKPTNPNILPEIRQSELRQENLQKEIALMQQQAATLTGLVTPAFEGLFNAFATGQPIGEALLDMFKQILIDLGKMVIKALIFKAILSALGKTNPLTAGMDLFGGAGGAIGGGLNIIGLLRGNDLALALDRTQTSYGYRRGG